MWQLSRQNISGQMISQQFFLERNIYISSLKKKTSPVRFEPRTFAVLGVFVTPHQKCPICEKFQLIMK